MMSIQIPVDEQISAMISGGTIRLLEKYFGEPRYDFNRVLTVTRMDLLHYLRSPSHAGEAEHYFVAHSYDPGNLHDVQRCKMIDEKYGVVEIDHGTARFIRTFDTVEEAVAEFLLTEHGM